jgi:glycerophosphoryl diester phosphodiesterase
MCERQCDAAIGCGRILLFFAILACSTPSPMSITRPRIVAHRGASFDAPENTLAAFRLAWQLGCEAIELDVRTTKDGHVVVIHDETTERTGGGVDRPVADQTLAEIRALDAGGWKGSTYAGETIPTLADVLATVPRGGAVFVEIKSGIETVPAVAAAIAAGDPSPRGGAVLLQSYDADVLAALSRAVPNAPAYWTVDPPDDGRYDRSVIDEAKARGFAGLALDYRGVDDEFVHAVRDAGLALDVWTINDAPTLSEWAARSGVRWIETDRPDLSPTTSPR